MRLGGFAASAEQPERGPERRPSTVTVLPSAGLQDLTRRFCFEAPFPLSHQSEMLDDVLMQHVLPSFHGIANKSS
jgi:hypothetical protein